MKAEITFSQVWWNRSILSFFFRSQAENTLNELMERAEEPDNALNCVENYAEENDCTLDDIEEIFYNDTLEEIAEEFGIELNEEEKDEDE